MPKLTLSEAIAAVEQKAGDSYPDLILVLAAAKAFACESCNGSGWVLIRKHFEDCPACAEFRRVAREGVQG